MKGSPAGRRGGRVYTSDAVRPKKHVADNQVDWLNSSQNDMTLAHEEVVGQQQQQQNSPGCDEANRADSPAEDLLHSAGTSSLKEGLIASRDNEITQGDKFFSLSDHSSWSSNEQLDLEADRTSSKLDSEMSSIVLGKESHDSSKNATVRKKQRKRSEQLGLNKHSTNSLDTKGLQWEYSKGDLTLHDNTEKQTNPVSLETIYQSIMEHREESKSESRRTQLACRKMQIQIRRVAKTCSEFATRMEEVETRISHLEDDAGSQQVTREAMEKQLGDTQWKLTDLEDRLRRNNLRVLGIPEGSEGSDTHSFMVALFKEAFPDLQ
ncbi:hypothetical protein NDU88_006913 [Pleurodeles waltl]|uniref:Uncharacterized protein n=1 Tax=Pleurodeles waltl TaxID=8319 RepID=A0AAV7RSK0_PLEWA|nr:hypothetical protein NDU88_006913 [Pleurodeles waltl]